MRSFEYWKKHHDSQHLEEFNDDKSGQLWLKIKSILRKELISKFTEKLNIVLSEKALNKQFVELFDILSLDIDVSNILLNNFINSEYNLRLSKFDFNQLISELYKMQTFDWGGDYNNSLDKYLVNRYVKQLKSYDTIIDKLDDEITLAVKGYVLNSWYNHWSSILIENIFKSHKNVLPTVGQIKNVDFFINDIPFDLKVTYLPSEFIKIKRKEKGLVPELIYLKEQAKIIGISYDKSAKDKDLLYEIVEKMNDRNDSNCISILQNIKQLKIDILSEAQKNPKILAKWLYENQGEMRFGSENRLFLVLVDTLDFTNSWKLKRNIEMLSPKINSYLDNFNMKNIEDMKLTFNFKGKSDTFSTLTDILFIIR